MPVLTIALPARRGRPRPCNQPRRPANEAFVPGAQRPLDTGMEPISGEQPVLPALHPELDLHACIVYIFIYLFIYRGGEMI